MPGEEKSSQPPLPFENVINPVYIAGVESAARYDYQGRIVLKKAAYLALIQKLEGEEEAYERLAFLPAGTVITMKEPGQVGR